MCAEQPTNQMDSLKEALVREIGVTESRQSNDPCLSHGVLLSMHRKLWRFLTRQIVLSGSGKCLDQ